MSRADPRPRHISQTSTNSSCISFRERLFSGVQTPKYSRTFYECVRDSMTSFAYAVETGDMIAQVHLETGDSRFVKRELVRLYCARQRTSVKLFWNRNAEASCLLQRRMSFPGLFLTQFYESCIGWDSGGQTTGLRAILNEKHRSRCLHRRLAPPSI